MNISFLLNKSPEQIVKYFQLKGYDLSWNWYETWQEAHTKAFTVAKVMRLDILQDIRLEVEKALKEGTTFETFKKNLEPLLKKKGWWGKMFVVDENGQAEQVQLGSVYRLKTIYTNNMNTSYSAGRWQAMWENRQNKPYLRYVSALRYTSRASHVAMHNKVFRIDDPIWQTLYPPNAYNCLCRAIAMSAADIDRYNDLVDQGMLSSEKLKVEDSKSNLVQEKVLISQKSGKYQTVTGYRDPLTGITTYPSPGWNYNVGRDTYYPDLDKYDKDLLKAYQKMKDDYADKQIEDAALILGKNTKTYVTVNDNLQRIKTGLMVDAYNGNKSKIVKVIKDFLGNEFYCTAFHYNDHVKESLGELSVFAKKNIEKITQNPDYILKDKKENAIIYGRYFKEKDEYLNVTVGLDSYMFYTIMTKNFLYKDNIINRYEVIMRKI